MDELASDESAKFTTPMDGYLAARRFAAPQRAFVSAL
jgi:hypothetical protein